MVCHLPSSCPLNSPLFRVTLSRATSLIGMLTVILCRNAVIIGPVETPFEDGTFRLVMQFEEQYPNKPPSVKFISQMFHPNVYATGELCLDILQNRWSPTYDVAAILTSIQRLTFSVLSLFHIPSSSPTASVSSFGVEAFALSWTVFRLDLTCLSSLVF